MPEYLGVPMTDENGTYWWPRETGSWQFCAPPTSGVLLLVALTKRQLRKVGLGTLTRELQAESDTYPQIFSVPGANLKTSAHFTTCSTPSPPVE